MPNDHVFPMHHLVSAPVLTRNAMSRLDGVQLVTPRAAKDDVLLRRSGCSVEFSDGMCVLSGREVHLEDMATRSRLTEGISVKLFLEGNVSASFNDYKLPMPKQDSTGQWQATGALLANSGPVWFDRSAVKGSYLDKVILDLPIGWVEQQMACASAEDAAHLRRIMEAEFSLWPWTPSPRACALGRQVLDLSVSTEPVPLARMLLKAVALGLVWEAFSALLADAKPLGDVSPGAQRLDALMLEVARHPGGPIALEDLAQRVGASLSTLQRQARRTYNKSLQELIRSTRLEEARATLVQGSTPITQLAFRAGYSSPANFTTAFRRQFGYPPSDIRRRGMTGVIG